MTAVLALLFSFSVSAAPVQIKEQKITVDIPEGYVILTPDTLKKQTDFIEHLGHSTESFKTYMKNAGMLLYAATEDNTRQIQVKSWQTDFSKEIGDLSSLDSEALEQAAAALITERPGEILLSKQQIRLGNSTYFEMTARVAGKQSDFCYVQYVTIQNGSLYALVYYNIGSELTAAQMSEARGLLSGFSVEKRSEGALSGSNVLLQIVIISAVILAASVLAVLMLLSFIKDLRSRKSDNDVSEYIRIKRRKF